jgi:predicted acetyltransferase
MVESLHTFAYRSLARMTGATPESEEVTLSLTGPSDEPVLSNLLELYLHDLSELFPIEVGANARFGYYPLAPYWQEPERRSAYLIRAGSRLAGFALVRRGSPLTDDPNDLDVVEFFVLRRHRRAGVGRRAAFLLWNKMPGHWIVRVAGNNHRGLAFWRAIIRDYTRSALSERVMQLPERAWHVLDLDSH